MINNVKNEGTVSGKLFGFGRYGIKLITEGKNKGKIQGSLIIATDAEETNLVEVTFIPQAPTYNNGKDNNNYKVLKQIMEEEKTIEKVGSSQAISLRISASLTTNPYFIQENGGKEWIMREPFQVQGRFFHIDANAKPYCGFNVDGLIENIEDKVNRDGTESTGVRMKIRVFDDWRKEFMPFSLDLEDEAGVEFVKSSYMPGETYANLSCIVENKTVEKQNENSMGFGTKAIVSQPAKINRLLVIGADSPKEDFPMTEEEMQQCKQNRNNRLADLKNKAIERAADKKTSNVNTGFGNNSQATSANNTTVNTTANTPVYNF